MKRYNTFTNHSKIQARGVYADLNLCYACGMKLDACLCVSLREYLDPIDYDAFMATNPDYSQIREKLAELKNIRAERNKRDKAEAIRVSTGMLDRTPTAAQLRAREQVDAAYMQALQSDEAEQEQLWGCLEILVEYIPPEPEAQDAENQVILDWLEGWNKLRPGPLGESPTETRSTLFGF
jgi:hypothetical protein